MYHFALLESCIDHAIGRLLEVEALQTAILARHIDFGNKVYILKSAASISGGQSEDVALLNKIGKLSEKRNDIAHCIFGPIEGGVVFLKVEARSELRFPKIELSDDEFRGLIDQIRSSRDDLEAMVERMVTPTSAILSEMVRKALSTPV